MIRQFFLLLKLRSSTAILLTLLPLNAAAAYRDFPKHSNIGGAKPGKVKFHRKQNVYAVTGSGANMWFKTDAFEYAYKQMSGDMTLTADLHFVGNGVEKHRKGALMIRQSLEPTSAYADAALHGDGLTSLQYRKAANTDTKEVRSDLKMPVRLRIERRGNQITMSAGQGSELKTSGPVMIELHDPVYVGLAVTSHNADVSETVVFSNVQIESATAGEKTK